MHLPASHVLNTKLMFPDEQSMGAWNRALFLAIERRDIEAIKLAIERGADVNRHSHFEELSTDHDGKYTSVRGGFTPLHQACLLSTEDQEDAPLVLEIVRFLLDVGGDPNALMHELDGSVAPKMSVLDAATLNEENFVPDLCDLLCAHGAKPTALTISLAVEKNPHFKALTDLYFGAVPAGRRGELLGAHSLTVLAEIPIDKELHIQRMACLVRQGAALDVRAKGRKLTPAQAIMKANPEQGKAVVQQLRQIKLAKGITLTPRQPY